MKNIEKIKREYRQRSPDSWIKFCEEQEEITTVVEFAAKAKNVYNKKHPHQYRIPNNILDKFCNEILNKIEALSNAENFDEIYEIIESCRLKGIRDLTIYDTAQRIGSFRKIYPNKVYIHAGTKIGAEKLLQKKIKDKALDKKVFRCFKDLTCAEIEDILCIYKAEISKSKCSRVEKIKKACA